MRERVRAEPSLLAGLTCVEGITYQAGGKLLSGITEQNAINLPFRCQGPSCHPHRFTTFYFALMKRVTRTEF